MMCKTGKGSHSDPDSQTYVTSVSQFIPWKKTENSAKALYNEKRILNSPLFTSAYNECFKAFRILV